MITKPKLILPEDQVLPTMLEAVSILKMLRQHTIKYNDQYGYDNRMNKQRWEEKADAFLSSLPIIDANNNNDAKENNNTGASQTSNG
jgi:hypothetical protein